MAMNNPYKQYEQNSITTATPEELTLMLYNGAIKFAKRAYIYIEENKISEVNTNLIKAQNIISELDGTLNMDYEMSEGLSNLYIYIKEQLMEANIQKDIKILDEVIPLIEDMRDNWKEAMEVAKQERLNPKTAEAY